MMRDWLNWLSWAVLVVGMCALWASGQERRSLGPTAYARGYAAAVDSVLDSAAPPETVRVVVRRGERVVHYYRDDAGLQVWP